MATTGSTFSARRAAWEEVLAAYKALKNTPTGDDAWHGRTGPFPIRQRTEEENTLSMRAFAEALQIETWSRAQAVRSA